VHEIHALAKLSKDLGIGGLHLQSFVAYLSWHEPMKLRPEDDALLGAQVQKARAELSGTPVALRVSFAMSETPEAADPPTTAPPFRDVLAGLDRIDSPAMPAGWGWDTAAVTFLEAARLDVPRALRDAALASAERARGAPEPAQPGDDAASESKKRERSAELLRELEHATTIRLPHCLAPYTMVYVLGDGAVRPCCVLDRRTADLGAESATTAWHSPAYAALRRSLASRSNLPEPCTGCNDGSRFAMARELLESARAQGVDVTKMELPPGPGVPGALALWLEEARARQPSPGDCASDASPR
jgi:hypothetical protein